MISSKRLSFENLISSTWHFIFIIALYNIVLVVLYSEIGIKGIAIPALPVSLLGIVVAFYVGFKNNSAYDRQWEARKIWGKVVSRSRMWGTLVRHYIEDETGEVHRELIYRQIAWVMILRDMMLKPKPWENKHILTYYPKDEFKKKNDFNDSVSYEIGKYLPYAEKVFYMNRNTPTVHLLDKQSKRLRELNKENRLTEFRQIELQKLVFEMTQMGGKTMRIKNYPLPRQYASVAFYFVLFFIFISPLAILGQFAGFQGGTYIWMSVPLSTIVSYTFFIMESVGNFSENPFSRHRNDIPIYALSRVVERDLLELLGEFDIPQRVKPEQEVLL